MYNQLAQNQGNTMQLDMKVFGGKDKECIVHTLVTGTLDYSHLCFMWYVKTEHATTYFTVNQIYDIRDGVIWVQMDSK